MMIIIIYDNDNDVDFDNEILTFPLLARWLAHCASVCEFKVNIIILNESNDLR